MHIKEITLLPHEDFFLEYFLIVAQNTDHHFIDKRSQCQSSISVMYPFAYSKNLKDKVIYSEF